MDKFFSNEEKWDTKPKRKQNPFCSQKRAKPWTDLMKLRQYPLTNKTAKKHSHILKPCMKTLH